MDLETEKAALAGLLEQHSPEMDFADATLVRASEFRPAFKLVTDDEHFEWHRRHQGRERFRWCGFQFEQVLTAMKNKKIILGVTGSIAAHKAADLAIAADQSRNATCAW